jgi:lysylphosphatidylglycerol synthetase-like protein (DUF2156 family)
MSQRPLGVAILAVLDFISGLLILGLGLFLIISNWQIGGGWTISGPSGVWATLFLAWAIIIVIIGFLYLAVAGGVWNGSEWAWTPCFVFSIIGVLVGFFFSFFELQEGIIIVLINIIALVYLMTRNVRAYFRKIASKGEESSEH